MYFQTFINHLYLSNQIINFKKYIMKRKSLLILAALMSVFVNSAYAGNIITCVPGDIVSAKVAAAADGDIVELTQSGDYLWNSSVKPLGIMNITIRAAAGLATRPVIKAVAPVNFNLLWLGTYAGAGNSSATFDGVVIDGMNIAPVVFTIKSMHASHNVDVTMNNCVVRGLVTVGTVTPTTFSYSNSATNKNPNNITVTNSIFDYTGAGVLNCTGEGRPKYATFTNCFFKGKFVKALFNAGTFTVDLWSLDHCTFDGNNGMDVSLWGNAEIKNCIFSNNSSTGSGSTANYFGTGGDLKTKCGVYYTGTSTGLFLDVMMDATTLRTDPKLDANGFATAPEYTTPGGTDSNPIGFYEANGLTLGYTALHTIRANNQISIYQNGSTFTVKGIDNASYAVYSVAGNQVANGQISNGTMQLNGVKQGMYILKTNNQVAKFELK